MQIRHYQGSDEQSLLDVWCASMPHDPIDARKFRTHVLLDPNFHPSKLLVAIEDAKIVGFLLCLTRQIPFFLHGLDPHSAWITAFGVDPEYRKRGIGTALFSRMFSDLRNEGRTVLDISPYLPNYFVPGIDTDAYPETLDFLRRRFGFQITSEAISMGIDLTNFAIPETIVDQIHDRELTEQLTIRTVVASDIPELMLFIAEQFGWDWYRHTNSYLQDYFGGNPKNICVIVARLHGEIIGFCQQRDERFGPFGVRSDCRGRGIGKMLLVKCLSIMKSYSVYYSYFLWTDAKAARLYANVGYKPRRKFVVLRADLR